MNLCNFKIRNVFWKFAHINVLEYWNSLQKYKSEKSVVFVKSKNLEKKSVDFVKSKKLEKSVEFV